MFFLVIGVVIYLYIYANNIPYNFNVPKKEEKETHKFLNEKSWIDKFSEFKRSNYIEPINTMLINIKLAKVIAPKSILKPIIKKDVVLKIKNSSEYSTFCLIQVLDSLNLEYYINKKEYLSSVFIKIKEDKTINIIKNKLAKLNVKVY